MLVTLANQPQQESFNSQTVLKHEFLRMRCALNSTKEAVGPCYCYIYITPDK